jgi:moderate conductance mechanosensitive channel
VASADQRDRRAARHSGLGLLAALWLTLATCVAMLLAAAPAAAQLSEPPGAPVAAEEPPPAEATGVAEALRLLAVVLEDPEARAALVGQLRDVEPDAPPAPSDRPPSDPAPLIDPDAILDPTVAQALAEQTLELAEEVGEQVRGILSELFALREILADARHYDPGEIWAGIGPVLTVIAVVLTAIWLLRLVTRPMLSRFEGSAVAAETAMAPVWWKFFGALVETARVAVAWGLGIGFALLVTVGTFPFEVGTFLSAFIWVEAARAVVRIVLRPRHPELRMLAITDPVARHWHFWLARIIGVYGYGTLFVVPLAEGLGADGLAAWLMLAVVLATSLMAVILILRNRLQVRKGLEAQLARAPDDMIVASLYPLAHGWHLIAIGYILALFVVWRAVPGDAVGFMVQATLSSAVVILIGALVIALITRRISGGIQLAEETRIAYPTLEDRLNRYVPAALRVARAVFVVVVLALILTFWGIFDAVAWVASPGGQTIGRSFLWIAFVLLLAGGVYIVVSSWVEYRLNPSVGEAPTPRERTLLALFSNAFVIVLAIITAMTVLTEVGINIAPLLAGAGVVGLAIGFGAQKLVQDIINGAFIQFENTMNEGDVVTAGGVTGVVEKLTIRSVSLRDLNGHYHMIPFSGVDTVTNFMKGFSYHLAEIDVAYRESIPDVKQAMFDAFDRLMETEHRANILPPLDMQGVVAFRDSGISVRARIKTLPGQQWATGRAYNEILKQVFDERDIEIPFPHRTIYMGVDKQGGSPPLNLRTLHREGRKRRGKESPANADRHRDGHTDPRPPEDLAAPEAEITPPAPEDV